MKTTTNTKTATNVVSILEGIRLRELRQAQGRELRKRVAPRVIETRRGVRRRPRPAA